MKKHRKYTDEFKNEALRLLDTTDRSASAIEQELGIKAVDETGQQLYELCHSFADMIRKQTSSALTSWLEKATQSNIKPYY